MRELVEEIGGEGDDTRGAARRLREGRRVQRRRGRVHHQAADELHDGPRTCSNPDLNPSPTMRNLGRALGRAPSTQASP